MSTANKLSYLNDTKLLLRTSLNKFGSNILTTDTFRSYDTKLNEIYDKLPKVTQSGAGFTLENVQNGQVDDFKMIGTDLEQNTTTGKNLFQSLITPSEFYKATYTKINDNSFSLNYTQSSTSNFSAFARIDLDISKLKPDTEYTISATNAVDGVTFSNIGALRTRINGVNGNVINSNILTFTTPNTIENVGIYFYIAYMNATTGTATITFNNIQVEEGSTATDYEPYTNGASPNPDYPQEIKVVEGRQVITDKGKNLFDVSQTPHSDNITSAGVTLNINDDGTISTSGTNTETYRNIRYDVQLPAGEYIISGCPTGGSKNGYSSLVQLTNETSSQVFDTGSGATFSLQETTTVKFYPVRVGSDTVNFNGLIFKPMIRLSNISNDTFESYYEPVSYNIDLQLANIYLAKMPNTDYKNRVYKNNGNWYFEEKVKKVVLDGSENWVTASASGGYRFVNNVSNPDGLIPLASEVGLIKCNKFMSVSATATLAGQNGIAIATSGKIVIYYDVYKNSSATAFKTWMSENNLETYYALANPVTTQITNTTLINQLEAISVYTGTNIITISNSNNIIPEIEITRLKELEKLA